MPTIEIRRELQFDAGHRLINHESKCKYLHGHRYCVEIFLQGGLDDVGRVMDFGDIKKKVGGWIDENWDHNMILHSEDPLAKFYLQIREAEKFEGMWPDFGGRPKIWSHEIFGDKPPYIFDQNPTAENLAAELFKVIHWKQMIPNHLTVTRIIINETPNCSATFKP
jgi:6-pyruvoyltetrahydropterin/6-carboxytetrahydropterin synthase